MGSLRELAQLTVQRLVDLHRESVDNLTFTVKGETGVYRRIPEVFDCWFESINAVCPIHYPRKSRAV